MDTILGMIAAFGFNFAPRDWSYCNGQLIRISDNTALFSLLGTTYGGDGINTFALPNLQGRVGIGQGQGPGLSYRPIGLVGGEEQVTLNTLQMPAHTHEMTASGNTPTQNTASGASLASGNRDVVMTNIYTSVGASVPMSSPTTPAGDGQAHENRQPYLAINYCIALYGIYPSRS